MTGRVQLSFGACQEEAQRVHAARPPVQDVREARLFLTYLVREMRSRRRQAVITALGFAVGAGLLITAAAASEGVANAYAAVLHALAKQHDHLHPGAPHEFDFIAFNTTAARRAIADGVLPGTRCPCPSAVAAVQPALINDRRNVLAIQPAPIR